MKKFFLILCLLIFSVFSGLYLVSKFWTSKNLHDYAQESPESTIKKYSEIILSDRQELEKFDVFKGSRGNNDAGVYLNDIVPFSVEGKKSLLSIDPEIVKKLYTNDWFTREIATVNSMDFSWMKRLSEFDYWSPEISNPEINLSDRPDVFNLPLPSYTLLINWAKLRLIHGKQTGSISDALKEVRQLARLTFTNDNLVSAMSAVAILRVETKFLTKNNLKMDDWKSVPDESLIKAKRYFWAIPSFVDPRLTNETYEKFSKTSVGECLMVSEGLNPIHMIKNHLSSDFSHEIARFDSTLDQSSKSCRKGVSHLAWKDPQWKSMSYSPVEISSGNLYGWYLSKNNSLLASLVLVMGMPNRFKLYESLNQNP
jgi:hypothetical protein